MRYVRQRWILLFLVLALGAAMAARADDATTLDERLDEERYLQGLIELQLPEVLERYLATHEPDDPIRAAQYEIAAHRMMMRRPGISTEKRLEGLESILEIRRTRLIEEHRDDSRWATWLADQASDLFFELLPTNGADLAALFGVPSDIQRRRAKRVAEDVHALAGEAEQAIEAVLLRLEDEPEYGRDMSLQMRHRRLDREERRRRIPFLRGVGALLQAELNTPEPDRKRALRVLAAETLRPLEERLAGRMRSQARLYAGLALAGLGEFEEAETRFRQVAADESAMGRDVFAARMGGVLNRFVSRGPEAALRGLASIEGRYTDARDMFYRLLIADRRFLLRGALAEQAEDEAARANLLAEAFDVYIELMKTETGAPRQAVRTIVYARLRQAARGSLPLDELPPIVTLARADRLARDEATRPEATRLYERLLRDRALDADERAAALFGLGRIQASEGRAGEAISLLTELARSHSTAAEAGEGIELAARVAAQRYEQAPADPAARADLREVLGLLLDEYPKLSSANQWRYIAGRLALKEKRYADALARFGQVTREAPTWPDAQFMKANVLRTWMRDETDPTLRLEHATGLRETIAQAEPALRMDAPDGEGDERSRASRYYLDFMRVFEAEALLELGRPEQALEALEVLEEAPATDPVVQAGALRCRIGAYEARGDADATRREIGRFMREAPDEVPAVVQPMLGAMIAEIRTLVEEDRSEETLAEARADLAPLAELVAGWLDRHATRSMEAEALRRLVADAYRLCDRHEEALAHYEALLRKEPNVLPLLAGKADCLFHLGGDDLAEAMRIYKRIAAAGTGEGDARAEHFWLAQLRMLQILDATQRNTHQILPRIRRLRQQDEGLGGRHLRRQFLRLENKYTGGGA